MNKKPFSKTLYDQDDTAKHQVVQWLEARNFKAWINDDRYGIDVLAERNNKSYEFEVEVKHNWKGEVFKYPGVHFSVRKLKFAKPEPTNFFFMLNDDRNRGLIVSGIDFLASPVIVKNTRYTSNEEFVEVDVTKAVFVDLEDTKFEYFD